MLFSRKLQNYFDAGIPAVQVITTEEKRLIKDISIIYDDPDNQVICWSLTQGFFKYGELMELSNNNPVEALAQISKRNEECYVMFDFDEFTRDIDVKRKLREIFPLLENSNKKIIFITKQLIEMDEILNLHYDLPDKDGIEIIFNDIVSSFESAEVMNGKKMEMKISGNLKEELINAALGLTEFEIKNAYSLAIIENKSLGNESVKTVQRLKSEQLSKGGVLEFFEPDVSLKDVGGNKALINYIEKRKKLYGKKARRKNVPLPKGIIITGITGTGKSLSSKMTGSYYNIPLIRLNIGALFGSLVGQSEERFRMATKQVDAIGRCVLWLDEIEKAFSGIKSGITGSDVSPRLFGEFLTWLTERSGEAFIVATCNDIFKLPPEITNRSRFDEVFFIDLPNSNERLEVLKIHLEKRKQIIPENLDKIIKKTEGYTSSEIEQIVKDAMINSFYDDEDISEKYLLESIDSIKPISIIMKEDIDRLRNVASNRFRYAAEMSEEQKLRIKGSRKITIRGKNPEDQKPWEN